MLVAELGGPLAGLVPWPVSLPAALMARLEGLAAARGVGRSRALRDSLSAGLAAWRMEGVVMDRNGAATSGRDRVRVTALLPAALLERVRGIGAATGVATRDVLAVCLYVGLAAGQGGDAGRAEDGAEKHKCSDSVRDE